MSKIAGRILIVEDEINIRAGLRDTLAKYEHTIMDVGSGEEALVALAASHFDVAIVDIRMPGMSGLELLWAIRDRWRHLAVIILTGHGDLESAMAAVKGGAFDYMLKPAQPESIHQTVQEAIVEARRNKKRADLIESLRASLSNLDDLGAPDRSNPPTSTGSRSLAIGDLQIDPLAHEVLQDGKTVQLSPTEFKLLSVLASRPGQVVDYATLTHLSLGYQATLFEAKELIKRHVFTLRHKIEPDPASPRYLLNVRGVGYRLVAAV